LHREKEVFRFFPEHFEVWEIQRYVLIELKKFHLEQHWNSSNMFLNQYGKVLMGGFRPSLSKKGSILGVFH
jgi:hypothetical protein